MLERLKSEKWLNKFELREFPEPEIIPLSHPVVLCHGYGAIASLVKPSPLYDVAMLMRACGVTAFAPNIVPYAKIEIRAQEWVDLLSKLLERERISKINIVAHSMGGLDIRYALNHSEIAPSVASLTTVSTPHRGTSLAELTLDAPDLLKNKMGDFLDWMGNYLYPKTKSDAVGSIQQLTRNYVKTRFNPRVPDLPDLPYYSYSAAVGKGTDAPIHTLTRFQNSHIYEEEGKNDGFVSVESSRWGEHIKTVPLSHLEQMNLRVSDKRKPLFESFWRDVLRMLSKKGH